MQSDLATLAARIGRLEQIERENASLRLSLQGERRRRRVQTVLAAVALVLAIVVAPGSRSAMAQAGNNLLTRVAALEAKTQFLSVSVDPVTGTADLYIVGTNVHIVNAAQPANANGLGNLIIGHNTSRTIAGAVDERTGSHNLVIGSRNNYTGMQGVVIGDFNTVAGFQSGIVGGGGHTAHDGWIYGGRGNEVSFGGLIFGAVRSLAQHDGVVLGGDDNFAGSFEGNVVVGGQRNSSIASFNTVIGGHDNSVPSVGVRTYRTIIGGL